MTEEDPTKILDKTARAINELVSDFDDREKSGRTFAPQEVRAIARQLQAHISDLLGAAERLRMDKPAGSSGPT